MNIKYSPKLLRFTVNVLIVFPYVLDLLNLNDFLIEFIVIILFSIEYPTLPLKVKDLYFALGLNLGSPTFLPFLFFFVFLAKCSFQRLSTFLQQTPKE